MLQQDGTNITKNIQKKFPKQFELVKGKNQVVFRLVNSIYNGKDRKPRSYHIPNAYAIQDDDGNVSEYLFYKNTKNKPTKLGTVLTEYLPPSIIFSPRGDLIINGKDKDLVMFMLNHPRRAKNKYGAGDKRPLFYLEDKNAEAVEKVQAESAKSKMKSLIYDEEHRLAEEDLRTIGGALRIPEASTMPLPLLQVSIEDQCKSNPSKFLQIKSVGKDVQMMSNLQKAAEQGFLKYDALKRKWVFVNKETKKEVLIAPVRPTEEEMPALVSWLKNQDTDGTYGKIMEMLTGKVQPTTASLNETEKIKAESERLEKENENLRLQLELSKAGGKTTTKDKVAEKNKPKAEVKS
jgi:hypothetical protein